MPVESDEQRKPQPTCPCCGTPMVTLSETETMVNLRCPACLISDLRVK